MAKAKTTPAPAAPAKKKRINRAVAAATVIRDLKKPATLAEINVLADKLFAEHGGKSNPDAQMYDTKLVVQIAEVFSVVSAERPTDVTIRPKA